MPPVTIGIATPLKTYLLYIGVDLPWVTTLCNRGQHGGPPPPDRYLYVDAKFYVPRETATHYEQHDAYPSVTGNRWAISPTGRNRPSARPSNCNRKMQEP
jgi:hypothetical protein